MKRSNMTPVVLGLTWLLSLGVVYIMGLFTAFAFHAEPGTGADSGLKSSEREAQALYEQLAGEPLDWAMLYSYNPQDRRPGQLGTIFEALSQLPDPASRRVLTERFFRVVGEVKTAAFLQERVQSARQHPEVFLGLLRAWHASDPASADGFLKAMILTGDAPPEWADAL